MRQEVYDWEQEQEFFLSFLHDSEELRDDGITYDEKVEALENYLVIPPPQSAGQNTPLSLRAALKDPESFQIAETWIAKLMLMNLSTDGFVHAAPVGAEDAFGAQVVSKLVQSGFRRPGNYRSMYVGYKDCVIFGQTIILPNWAYWEGVQTSVRSSIDMFDGREIVEREEYMVPRQDDVVFIPVDVDDFFPYPGEDNLEHMLFAAHRYVIPAHVAMQFAEDGRWEKAEVEKALYADKSERTGKGASWDPSEAEDKSWRWTMDRTVHDRVSDLYKPVVAVEGWGEVPYKTSDDQRLRRMTLLNGCLVESRPSPISMPRRVPYCDMVMNPIKGRWRGISPLVVNRFTQSFNDALLICMADAVIKMTNSPVLVDQNSGIDISQLEAWTGPIRAQDINGVRELAYNPQLGPAFQMYMGNKASQQQASGMLGGLQGQGLGTKRFSASEAVETFKQALDRPSMMAQLFENEYLPALGRMVFELYQQFLPSSYELARRVGTSTMMKNRMPSLNDINGDYDLKFIGSSRVQSKEIQLQFLERSFQVFGSVPGAAPIYPWTEALIKWLELADLRDLEAMVANPNGVEDFITRSQAMQGSPNAAGNGNQEPASLGQINLATGMDTGAA